MHGNYPKLMHYNNDLIVKFVGSQEGYTVRVGALKDERVGEYKVSWNQLAFEIYDGPDYDELMKEFPDLKKNHNCQRTNNRRNCNECGGSH